jgi:hypothetical protein
MSQRGAEVKGVDRLGIVTISGAIPSSGRNETSPAQDVESGESWQTQPLVVLPEGLTAQKKL